MESSGTGPDMDRETEISQEKWKPRIPTALVVLLGLYFGIYVLFRGLNVLEHEEWQEKTGKRHEVRGPMVEVTGEELEEIRRRFAPFQVTGKVVKTGNLHFFFSPLCWIEQKCWEFLRR